MQPRIQFAFWAVRACCWLMPFAHQYPQVLLGRAVLHHFIPQLVPDRVVATTQVPDITVGYVKPHEVHLSPLLLPSRSLWMAPHLRGVLSAPHSFISSTSSLWVHSTPLSTSWMKTVKSTSPSTDPRVRATSHWSPSRHSTIDHHSLGTNQFLIQQTFHSSNFYLSNLERRVFPHNISEALMKSRWTQWLFPHPPMRLYHHQMSGRTHPWWSHACYAIPPPPLPQRSAPRPYLTQSEADKLSVPWAALSTLLKKWVEPCFFPPTPPSLGTSPDHYDFSNIIECDLVTTSIPSGLWNTSHQDP